MTAAARLPDAGDVSGMLARQAEQLCEQLLSAGRRNGGYWTVGGLDNARGKSLWVHLYGPKAGHWQDGATGEFGDALDLVAGCLHRGDTKQAYRWALDWLGISGTGMGHAPRPEAARALERQGPSDDDKRRSALAMWLHAEEKVAFTPVDAYLESRGIKLAELGRQPRALRYHRELYHHGSRMRWPAMVAAISGPDGTHLATHRTWLERVGGGWQKARIEPNKMVLGSFAGGSIRISRGASGKSLKNAGADEVVLIGEGIETCLSVALAVPEYRILCAISLGNMGSVWLPEQIRNVRLLADNDTKHEAHMGLQRAVERHMAAGRRVEISRPPLGNDFNDTLRGWK